MILVPQTTNDDAARTPPSTVGGVNPPESPLKIVVPAAAAMAVGMGIGRFVYTPILPLMHAQAGLGPQLGAHVATANYAGYLAGAAAGIAAPALVRSRPTLRLSLAVVVATLAAMPLFSTGQAWIVLRFVAGTASALIFMIAATALLTGLRVHGQQLIGWGFGGVGIGIGISGVLILALHAVGSWRLAWWSAAALSLVLTVVAWPLPASTQATIPNADATAAPARRWFASLMAAYTLEGVGYIIAGTFLVAAIDQNAPANVGNSAWILVGAAALPSSALWAGLSRVWSRPTLLTAALVTQAVGVALPAVFGGTTAALASAILFGATFLGIGTIALAAGTHLRTPHAVAILTTGYSAGQILGPILVSPLLDHGYQQALLVSTAIIAIAALAALTLRHRFPHHLGPPPTRVRSASGHTNPTPGRAPLPRRDPMTSANAGPSAYPWIGSCHGISRRHGHHRP
jgi:MFS family permease